eukprot:191330_1
MFNYQFNTVPYSEELQTQFFDKGLQAKLLQQQKLKLRPIIRQIVLDLSKYVNIVKHQSLNALCYPIVAYLACFYGFEDQSLKYKYSKASILKLFEFFVKDFTQYP